MLLYEFWSRTQDIYGNVVNPQCPGHNQQLFLSQIQKRITLILIITDL